MKVAFWNTIPMSEDVVNYMAAVGIILAFEYHCEVVLSSTYISNHMLQDCFSGKTKNGMVPSPYRFLYGSMEYSRALWSMKGNKKDNILEIPMNGLTIVYPPEAAEKQMFYHEISRNSFYLLDTACESGTVFQRTLEEADLFVVFLPQNKAEIQKFFYQFSTVIPNTIFVIEEVQLAEKLLYRKIVTDYGIKNKNIAGIPKSKTYKEACEEGSLVSYLMGIQSTKDSQYPFLSGIRRAAKIIYERSGFGMEKECGKYKKR